MFGLRGAAAAGADCSDFCPRPLSAARASPPVSLANRTVWRLLHSSPFWPDCSALLVGGGCVLPLVFDALGCGRLLGLAWACIFHAWRSSPPCWSGARRRLVPGPCRPAALRRTGPLAGLLFLVLAAFALRDARLRLVVDRRRPAFGLDLLRSLFARRFRRRLLEPALDRRPVASGRRSLRFESVPCWPGFDSPTVAGPAAVRPA